MMQRSPDSQSSPDRAQQVCSSCKAGKRKCDKILPKCSSCSMRGLTCDYSQLEPNHNQVSNRLWYSSPSDEDQRADIQSIDFPTMLFLDPSILQHGQIESSRAATPIPSHILQLLGDTDEIRATASKFFEHIHSWMPFISKKRFYELYLRSSFRSQPDIVLLFLSLKLITTSPSERPRNVRTPLYYATKHFYLEIENSTIFSILVLQAGVLLSIYELGHAIYPAAFLTIGACARYAHALGIKGSRTLHTTRVLSLVEAEERKRTWWAIVILDRYVGIGCPGRPFATADPRLDDILPTNDAEWDQGIVRLEDSFTLSSPMTGHMSKFALLCQAARLLGQVLQLVSSDSLGHEDDISVQLDRTLQSMLAAALNTELPDYEHIVFIYNALVVLHKPWLPCKKATMIDTERSQRARAIFEQMSETMAELLLQPKFRLDRNLEDIPPWGFFCAYNICGLHMRFARENPESAEIVKNMRVRFLQHDARWNVAGVYLQLLEAQEVMEHFLPT